MILKRPTQEMKNNYLDFAQEWKSHDENITPYSARLLEKTYEEWLNNTYDFEKRHDGFVPAHTYFFIDDRDNIIGAVNIRHYLNDKLLKSGGHIGYGIRPTQRKKGYATKMLAMALLIAKELGITKVLITCNKGNAGSARTIVNNGGILENEVLDGDELIQRYWVCLE